MAEPQQPPPSRALAILRDRRLRLALLSARSQPERAALRDAVQTLELRAVPR